MKLLRTKPKKVSSIMELARNVGLRRNMRAKADEGAGTTTPCIMRASGVRDAGGRRSLEDNVDPMAMVIKVGLKLRRRAMTLKFIIKKEKAIAVATTSKATREANTNRTTTATEDLKRGNTEVCAAGNTSNQSTTIEEVMASTEGRQILMLMELTLSRATTNRHTMSQ